MDSRSPRMIASLQVVLQINDQPISNVQADGSARTSSRASVATSRLQVVFGSQFELVDRRLLAAFG